MTEDRHSPSDLAAELAKALFGAELPKARTKSRRRSGSSLRKREFEEALTPPENLDNFAPPGDKLAEVGGR